MSENKLGEFIKSKRLDNHLTREKLSVALNISASHLNAIERGLRVPSRDLLRLIANELGLTIETLYEQLNPEEGENITQQVTTKPKSRIPSSPPETPLEPELEAALNDPRLGKRFFSKQYMARFSKEELREIALNALTTLKEIEDYEASEKRDTGVKNGSTGKFRQNNSTT